MKWCRSVLLIQSGMNKAVDFFIALWIKSPDSVTVPVNQTNFIAESLVIWWKELYCWFWSPVCDGSSSKMKFVWYSFFYGVQSYIINYICNIMMHNVLVVGLQHCSLYNSGIYYSIFWSHWGKMLITMKNNYENTENFRLKSWVSFAYIGVQIWDDKNNYIESKVIKMCLVNQIHQKGHTG